MTWTRRLTFPSLLIGGALLTGSLVGANRILYSPGSGDGTTAPAVTPPPVPNAGVVCNGIVDVEPGLLPLSPSVPGEVIEVLVHENQKVKAGDVLVKLDDSLARSLLTEAQRGLAEANAKLAQAEQGIEAHRKLIDEQQAAIDGKRFQAKSAQFQLDRLKRLQSSQYSSVEEVAAAAEGVKALGEAVKAEEVRMERLKLSNPKALVDEAKAAVGRLEEKVNQAQLGLDRCQLQAPTDGTVIRLGVAKGSLISAQSRGPAVWFCPAGPRVVRAEIDQEYVVRVAAGQRATIQDDIHPSYSWTGTLQRLSEAFLPKRSSTGAEFNPLFPTDSRTLECLIVLDDSPTPPRVGQRVRVTISSK